jgi:hypothetical protein
MPIWLLILVGFIQKVEARAIAKRLAAVAVLI